MKALLRRPQANELSSHEGQPARVAAATPEKYSFRRFIVSVTERRDGALLSGLARRYEFQQLPDFHLQCSDPHCRNGGILLTPIVREMLEDHENERLLMELCPGRVSLPDKKTVRVKCQGMFVIRLHFVRGAVG